MDLPIVDKIHPRRGPTWSWRWDYTHWRGVSPLGAAESHRRTSLPKGTWRKRDGQNWTHEFLHRSLHRTPGWTSFLGRRLFKHLSGVLELQLRLDFKKNTESTELEGTTRENLRTNKTIIKQIKQQSYCFTIQIIMILENMLAAHDIIIENRMTSFIVFGQGSKLGRAKQDLGTMLQTRMHQAAIATTGLQAIIQWTSAHEANATSTGMVSYLDWQ